ncbi:hypothetical protein [uncultured Pelagimonas sp.]|uniref:hypothetical protein n=1 Tax=uncultured Pelagimonas sp. TaxID=1618102 RepID=UPI002619184E|nr:hypothetical protein [uncultured Pelagimonas sp.]
MTNLKDPAEPADLLLHDLRRFLHNAHDQQASLNKISKAMASSTSHMKSQEGAIGRILQNLQTQLEKGVAVHIDADLKAHIAKVSTVTSPLVSELQKASRSARQFTIMITLVAFSAGFSGGLLGVLAALRLM